MSLAASTLHFEKCYEFMLCEKTKHRTLFRQSPDVVLKLQTEGGSMEVEEEFRAYLLNSPDLVSYRSLVLHCDLIGRVLECWKSNPLCYTNNRSNVYHLWMYFALPIYSLQDLYVAIKEACCQINQSLIGMNIHSEVDMSHLIIESHERQNIDSLTDVNNQTANNASDASISVSDESDNESEWSASDPVYYTRSDFSKKSKYSLLKNSVQPTSAMVHYEKNKNMNERHTDSNDHATLKNCCSDNNATKEHSTSSKIDMSSPSLKEVSIDSVKKVMTSQSDTERNSNNASRTLHYDIETYPYSKYVWSYNASTNQSCSTNMATYTYEVPKIDSLTDINNQTANNASDASFSGGDDYTNEPVLNYHNHATLKNCCSNNNATKKHSVSSNVGMSFPASKKLRFDLVPNVMTSHSDTERSSNNARSILHHNIETNPYSKSVRFENTSTNPSSCANMDTSIQNPNVSCTVTSNSNIIPSTATSNHHANSISTFDKELNDSNDSKLWYRLFKRDTSTSLKSKNDRRRIAAKLNTTSEALQANLLANKLIPYIISNSEHINIIDDERKKLRHGSIRCIGHLTVQGNDPLDKIRWEVSFGTNIVMIMDTPTILYLVKCKGGDDYDYYHVRSLSSTVPYTPPTMM
jgi:hypothetical protein